MEMGSLILRLRLRISVLRVVIMILEPLPPLEVVVPRLTFT